MPPENPYDESYCSPSREAYFESRHQTVDEVAAAAAEARAIAEAQAHAAARAASLEGVRQALLSPHQSNMAAALSSLPAQNALSWGIPKQVIRFVPSERVKVNAR